MPSFPGSDVFQGEIHHSSEHSDSAAYAGKTCVVVGSNTSAHDISRALWEAGAAVTMVQRSATCVCKSEALLKGLEDLYSERAVANGITTDEADLLFASTPYRLLPTSQTPIYAEIARDDAEFYRDLAEAGFLLDFGDDGRKDGIFMKYLRRGSGYYIDVGASQFIIDKKIKLESGTEVERLTENSVKLKSGKELPADLVVLATGYGPMIGWAEKLISKDVADIVGPIWGLGAGTRGDPGPFEGELRNMWKPTKQPGLWFHGGNLHQARHYSKFLALQLKARFEGIPTNVYISRSSTGSGDAPSPRGAEEAL